MDEYHKRIKIYIIELNVTSSSKRKGNLGIPSHAPKRDGTLINTKKADSKSK